MRPSASKSIVAVEACVVSEKQIRAESNFRCPETNDMREKKNQS